MLVLEVIKGSKHVRSALEEIVKEKSFIAVLRMTNDMGGYYITSFIVNHNKVKFFSMNNPSLCMFTDYDKDMILETAGKTPFEEIYFNIFDRMTYRKLIDFSKEYDKMCDGVSADFYRKYQEQILENIIKE